MVDHHQKPTLLSSCVAVIVINIIIIMCTWEGVAMSTSAATPFRSFVQTPIFSVSPSSFSL